MSFPGDRVFTSSTYCWWYNTIASNDIAAVFLTFLLSGATAVTLCNYARSWQCAQAGLSQSKAMVWFLQLKLSLICVPQRATVFLPEILNLNVCVRICVCACVSGFARQPAAGWIITLPVNVDSKCLSKWRNVFSQLLSSMLPAHSCVLSTYSTFSVCVYYK